MIISPLEWDKLPDHFREDDARYVFEMLMAGESCSLVACGSVGKSSFLRFLIRPDVRRRYLGDERAQRFVLALVDPHEMVRLHGDALADAGPHWSGYEVMLDRLRNALADMMNCGLIGPGDKERVKDKSLELLGNRLYRPMVMGGRIALQMGLRYLERAVHSIFFLGDEWRVVFLLDEIEEFLSLLPEPAVFFQSLRGLRDEFKRRLMFVTASRRSFEELTEDLLRRCRSDKERDKVRVEFEGFAELFHEFTRYLSPLDYPSARASVKRLANRYRHHSVLASLTSPRCDEVTRLLFDATGGHVGLMRRAFLPAAHIVLEGQQGDYVSILLQSRGVQRECATILDSLSRGERDELERVARGERCLDRVLCARLEEKHLIVRQDSSYAVTFPILREFVLRQMG